jgi:hypothetical protein
MTASVKDAVFGNVGSIISFRMGAGDARSMVKYFEPHFSDYDLVHTHNRNFAINMTIEGEKVESFSGTTLNLPVSPTNFSAEIISNSRQKYSYKRVDIENIMQDRYNQEHDRAEEINIRTANKKSKVSTPPKPKSQPIKTPIQQTKSNNPVLSLGVIANSKEDKIEVTKVQQSQVSQINKPASFPLKVDVPVVPVKVTIPTNSIERPKYGEVQDLSENKIINLR